MCSLLMQSKDLHHLHTLFRYGKYSEYVNLKRGGKKYFNEKLQFLDKIIDPISNKNLKFR